MDSFNVKGRTATPTLNGLFHGLLSEDEVDAIMTSSLHNGQSFTPSELAKIVAWCNATRINERLLTALLSGDLYIKDLRNGEPIFHPTSTALENAKDKRSSAKARRGAGSSKVKEKGLEEEEGREEEAQTELESNSSEEENEG
jgi:hypothetical protein